MEVDLSGLQLQNLSGHEVNSNNIYHLNISNNTFTSLASISLLNLTKLYAKGNAQLTSLLGLPSTIVELDVSYCGLTDLNGISSGIIYLNAAGNNISDISALVSVTNRMHILDLSHNNITSVTNIPQCFKLYLNDNQITSFNATVSATFVYIRNNSISSWTGFETWTDTREIDITGTNLTSLALPLSNIILIHDVPTNIINFTNSNVLTLRKNEGIHRGKSLYASIEYNSLSLLPLSGYTPDQLSLSVSQWRRINGISNGGAHAGNITTRINYGELFLPGSATETNILKYIGSGPTVFMLSLQLTINPALGFVYFMISKNRTANQINITNNDIDLNNGRDFILSSSINIVSGSGLISLMANDTLTFYSASSSGCIVSIDSFFFLIKPV